MHFLFVLRVSFSQKTQYYVKLNAHVQIPDWPEKAFTFYSKFSYILLGHFNILQLSYKSMFRTNFYVLVESTYIISGTTV